MVPSIPTFKTPERSAKVSPRAASRTGPESRRLAASHVTKKAEVMSRCKFMSANLHIGGRSQRSQVHPVTAKNVAGQHHQHDEALQNESNGRGNAGAALHGICAHCHAPIQNGRGHYSERVELRQ